VWAVLVVYAEHRRVVAADDGVAVKTDADAIAVKVSDAQASTVPRVREITMILL
jgi:hypothetical protein